jgi:hypothetical protein
MVMHEGKSTETLGIADATQERIMALATGIANNTGISNTAQVA